MECWWRCLIAGVLLRVSLLVASLDDDTSKGSGWVMAWVFRCYGFHTSAADFFKFNQTAEEMIPCHAI